MDSNSKDIHIGRIIKLRVQELNISTSRMSNFFKCSEDDINKIFNSESLDSNLLLKWSKLLEYDLFRLYTQHLIFYSPQKGADYNQRQIKSVLPQFRKNIYTKDIINFILGMLETGEKTKRQIIKEYRIPKSTLYKWIHKYGNSLKI